MCEAWRGFKRFGPLTLVLADGAMLSRHSGEGSAMSLRPLRLAWAQTRTEVAGLIYMYSARAYDWALCDLIALRARS